MVKEWKRTAYKDHHTTYETRIGWDAEAQFVEISLIDRTLDESAKIQVCKITDHVDKITYNAIFIPVAPWFGDFLPKQVLQEIVDTGSFNVLVDYRNTNTGNVYEIAGAVQKSTDPAANRRLSIGCRDEYDKNGRHEWKQIALVIPTDDTRLKSMENGNETDDTFTKINTRLAKIDNKADRALHSNHATNTALAKFIRKNFVQRMRWLFFGK